MSIFSFIMNAAILNSLSFLEVMFQLGHTVLSVRDMKQHIAQKLFQEQIENIQRNMSLYPLL